MRKINRRNFLKVTGVLAAASALAACGGSSTSTAGSTGSTAGSAASADGAKAYNELTVGTDNTDLKADLKIISHRTDLIDDGTFDGYVAAFQKLYPNITIKYEGITDYANDMTTRLTSNDWGDLCMIPTTIPLTELGDYFEPLCALSDIENDYNFASNRAYNGSVYGIPSTGNAQGIVYNKKVFEAAGITTLPKTPDEFRKAVQDAKKESVSCIIDAKVLPKTMAEGYESWWHIGVASTSKSDEVKAARKRIDDHLAEARMY